MSMADFINACFEVGGIGFNSINIYKLWKDKKVSGTFWPSTAFYSVWGIYNIYFYLSVHTPLSLISGFGVILTNIVWVIMAIYYSRKRC